MGGRAIVYISTEPARPERYQIFTGSIKQLDTWWTGEGMDAPLNVVQRKAVPAQNMPSFHRINGGVDIASI
jgi:hypothetical protein